MNKHQLLSELQQLHSHSELDPESVLTQAEDLLNIAKKIEYSSGILLALIVMSRCHWCSMNYRQGLSCIKEAHTYQNNLETDEYLPEILHIYALQFWGQGKYYTAQQFWISALEQAALLDEQDILIESLIGLGNVWRITNEFRLAHQTHELALKVARHNQADWLTSKACILLAWDLYLLEQYAEMLTILDDAELLLKNHSNQTWQAEVWDFRGLALLSLGRLETAEIATKKAYQIAERYNLTWIKAQSYISRAKLEFLRQNYAKAAHLLAESERSALRFDHGELLSQICFQQSRVAEERGFYKEALMAYRKYRHYSTRILHQQIIRNSLDKARLSKRVLDQRARKLVNHIKEQYEYDPEKHYLQLVPESYWWQQLILFKAQLKETEHSVLIIHHTDPDILDTCVALIHSLCTHKDSLTRLNHHLLGLLLLGKDKEAEHFQQTVQQMITLYPWYRKGFSGDLPQVSLSSVSAFPFTIEQLEFMTTLEMQ